MAYRQMLVQCIECKNQGLWGSMISLRHQIAAIAIALVCVESALAMDGSPSRTRCSVVGAERLAGGSIDARAICLAMDGALSGWADARQVTVTIKNASRASAVVTLVDGRQLPDVHVASSDGVLKQSSLQMLANGVAAQRKGKSGD